MSVLGLASVLVFSLVLLDVVLALLLVFACALVLALVLVFVLGLDLFSVSVLGFVGHKGSPVGKTRGI